MGHFSRALEVRSKDNEKEYESDRMDAISSSLNFQGYYPSSTTVYTVTATATYWLGKGYSPSVKFGLNTTLASAFVFEYWGPTTAYYPQGVPINTNPLLPGATFTPTSSASLISQAPPTTSGSTPTATSTPRPNNAGLIAGVAVLALLFVFSLLGIGLLLLRRSE